MNLESRYALPAGVKFRHEDFGGVVYQRSGDRLHFITSLLAAKLLSLAGTGTVWGIVAAIAANAPEREAVQEHILKTLCTLEELGIIYELGDRDGAAEGAGMPDLADHKQV